MGNIFKNHLLFIWNSNVTGCPVSYSAILLRSQLKTRALSGFKRGNVSWVLKEADGEAELGGQKGYLQWNLWKEREEAGLDRGAPAGDAPLTKSLPTPAGALNKVSLEESPWVEMDGLVSPSCSGSSQPSPKVASLLRTLMPKSLIKKPLTPKTENWLNSLPFHTDILCFHEL